MKLEAFLKRIVTVDETWIRDIEPELKSHLMKWKGSMCIAKFRLQQTKVKQMVIFTYDYKGVQVCDRATPKINIDGD